jgi:hypothetical protein
MPGRYGKRRLVAVELQGVSTYMYGWKTSLDATTSTTFGHTAAESAGTKPVIFGASRPKPVRAALKSTGQSSFLDKAKLADAGFNLISKETSFALPRTSDKSVTVYVSYEGVMFAWHQPTEVRNKATDGELTKLGVKPVDNTVKAALGVNTIMKNGSFIGKPPRARKVVDASGEIDTVSSYYGVAALPTGWI